MHHLVQIGQIDGPTEYISQMHHVFGPQVAVDHVHLFARTLARPVSCPIVYQDIVHRVQVSTDTSGRVFLTAGFLRLQVHSGSRPLIFVDIRLLRRFRDPTIWVAT